MVNSSVREYSPFFVRPNTPLDMGRLGRLHDRVVDFRDSFLSDHDVQDLLLADGYQVEGVRPTTWCAIHNAVIHRSQVAVQLDVLNRMVDLATRPRLVAVSRPRIITPGTADTLSFTTPEQYDALGVEWLQDQWFSHPDTVSLVRRFGSGLSDSLNEFNLQFVLNRFYRVKDRIVDPSWGSGKKQSQVREVFFPDGFTVLDSAYYNAGRRNFPSLNSLHEKLQGDELGRLFVLSPEEIIQGVFAHRE